MIPWGRGLFPLLAGLFLWMRLAEDGNGIPTWARWYLDDFLCLPLVLCLALFVQRMVRRSDQWILPRSHGMVALVLYAIYFEMVLPWAGTAATADPVDVLMYAWGLGLFLWGLNRPAVGRANPSGNPCGPHLSC